MAGFQEQWRNLADELTEHADESPDWSVPSCHRIDPSVIPVTTDDCTFDIASALRAEAGLCLKFSQSEHGVTVAPFTSHYDLCVSRFDTFPAFYDNAYLRISPYWNNTFVLIYTPHVDDRVAGTQIEHRCVLAPFAKVHELAVDWLPRLS